MLGWEGDAGIRVSNWPFWNVGMLGMGMGKVGMGMGKMGKCEW